MVPCSVKSHPQVRQTLELRFVMAFPPSPLKSKAAAKESCHFRPFSLPLDYKYTKIQGLTDFHKTSGIKVVRIFKGLRPHAADLRFFVFFWLIFF